MMRYLLSLAIFMLSHILCAQKFNIRGVTSDNNLAPLPFANVAVFPDSVYQSSDAEGKFHLSVSRGIKTIVVTFTGHETQRISAFVSADTVLNVLLPQKVDELKEITVTADRFTNQDLVESTRSGVNTITQKDIFSIPVLMGEADVIKTLQLLPGTIRGVEGSSDLFVRGGAADQNLVLLDNAPIYNTSHLFGFLSVFNPDMLERVDAMNGAFPPAYGGRLSSILDIKSKSVIADRTHVSGDVGLIASRLFIDQPIVKDKASLWVAGRRTYIDQVVRAVGQELPYFFYDLNAKLLLQPTDVDQIQFSHYNGEDILDIFRDANNDGSGFLTSYTSGNSSQSLQWNHTHQKSWQSNLSLFRSGYKYNIRNAFEENEVAAFSDIEDLGVKGSIRFSSPDKKVNVQLGTEWTRHEISPNVINSIGSIAELLSPSASDARVADELALFAQTEFPLNEHWQVDAGIRGSAGVIANKVFINPEPRFAARYAIAKDHALKFSYSRMSQYIHRISNAAVSMPTDVWYPVTDSVKPQLSHQLSAAWQRFFPASKVYMSVESYYKSMSNLVGYEEGTNLFFNADFESKLIQGTGKSYGLEFLLKKEAGRFTGWVSYTLSWSWRRYNEIANGRWFHARYDRRHNGALVMQYALTKRLSASLVWEFISGSRFTPVIGQYTVLAPTLTGFDLIPIYADINGVKLADAHRLDVGLKYASRESRRFRWQVFAGVYNAYNRASPVGIIIEQDETDGSLSYSQPGLFGLLPFISYGFKI